MQYGEQKNTQFYLYLGGAVAKFNASLRVDFQYEHLKLSPDHNPSKEQVLRLPLPDSVISPKFVLQVIRISHYSQIEVWMYVFGSFLSFQQSAKCGQNLSIEN